MIFTRREGRGDIVNLELPAQFVNLPWLDYYLTLTFQFKGHGGSLKLTLGGRTVL